MATTQKGRLLRIDTPLGEDVLLIERFEMKEAISKPFSIRVQAVAELTKAPSVTAKALIGKPAVITIELPDNKKRFFHGMVRALTAGGRGFEERFARFELEIVPRLARLRDRTDCRIFQEMSADEVVKQVLNDMGIEFRDAFTKTYTKRDYCVQYRETDLEFISRLMEEEAIHYFFEHKLDKHVMVLADSPQANQPCPEQDKANFEEEGGFGDAVDSVQNWQFTEQLRSGLSTARDHHFQLPDKRLEFSEATSIKIGDNQDLELYDYPGEYALRFKEPDKRLGDVEKEGQKVVRTRMEEEEASFAVVEGLSVVRAFVSGFRFTLERHFRSDFNTDWLLTSVEHTVRQSPDYASGDPVPHAYTNAFTCIPHKVPFLPERGTEKPVVGGPQTAVVTGPPGEEIFPDKYGRVKVQFFWDRKGKQDANSSCWIRVATPWAGKNWGMIHIPRIGQEVVVQFLEGDPDRPMIIGSVYNAQQMPPYSLPDNKTQSGIKSRSSLGGGSANFNEIRFEDKKGKEEVNIHAERQLTTSVEANEFRTVGANRTTTIQKNDKLTVKEENLEIIVEKGDRSADILQGNDIIFVQQGNAEKQVPVGTDRLDAKEVLITATTHLKITCGASSIEMTPAMITIQSPMVKIN